MLRRRVFLPTPGFKIGNLLDRNVKTFKLLKQDAIGLCQPQTLLII